MSGAKRLALHGTSGQVTNAELKTFGQGPYKKIHEGTKAK